jgi:hypothetical protein
VGGDAFERKLLADWKTDTDRQLAAVTPTNHDKWLKFQAIVAPAWETLIGRKLPSATSLKYDQTDKVDQGNWIRMGGLLRNTAQGEEIPVRFFYPKTWNGCVAIWLCDQGSQGICNADGEPAEAVRGLLAHGTAIASADLLYQGEFLAAGTLLERTRRVENNREAAAYTYGYNPTVFAQRVHDVLNLISFVQGHERKPKRIDLVALEPITSSIAAAARLQAGEAINRCAIHTHGFRFGSVTDFQDVRFQPGVAKYADLPGLLAAAGPRRLWLAGETADSTSIVAHVFTTHRDASGLQMLNEQEKEMNSSVTRFLQQEAK